MGVDAEAIIVNVAIGNANVAAVKDIGIRHIDAVLVRTECAQRVVDSDRDIPRGEPAGLAVCATDKAPVPESKPSPPSSTPEAKLRSQKISPPPSPPFFTSVMRNSQSPDVMSETVKPSKFDIEN